MIDVMGGVIPVLSLQSQGQRHRPDPCSPQLCSLGSAGPGGSAGVAGSVGAAGSRPPCEHLRLPLVGRESTCREGGGAVSRLC